MGRSGVALFKRLVEFGSSQGRVVGHLLRPVPDSCLVSGRPVPPCLTCRVGFFPGWDEFFWLCVVFFRVGSGFGSKITARELLRVKKCGPYPPVVLVGSGRTGFFSGELAGSGGP
jgi:hypothetical protein